MPLQQWAHRLGLGRRTGIDLPGESPGLIPSPKWRDALFNQKPKLTDRPWSVGRQHQPVRRPGRPAGQPAADGGRLRRDRQRRARPARRGSGCGSRTPPAARSRSSTRRRPGAVKISPEYRAARSSRACAARRARRAARRPRCSRASRSRSPARPARPSSVGKADQSWYVALAPYPNPRYVVAVTDEPGGFGADTAAPMARRILAALFDVKENGLVAGRRGARLMQASAATAVKDFRDDARARFLRLDPLLLAGHARADRRQLYIVGSATQDDIPGDPNYYVYRQAAYGGVGLLLMLAARALRLLAPARVEARHLRLHDRARSCSCTRSGVSARGSKRAIDAAVLQLPAVRARQGAADPRRWRPSWSTGSGGWTTARPPAGSCCWR